MNPVLPQSAGGSKNNRGTGNASCQSGALFDVLRIAFLLTTFACALFTALASGAVLAGALTGMLPAPGRFVLVLAAKMALFGAVALGSAWALKRWGRSSPLLSPGDRMRYRDRAISLPALLIPLAVTALLVFPRLDAYPWPAPDETFHLTMARNLAVYGQYASGRPETGFVPFDGYASVGPAVLIPVAIAFKTFGVSLVVARAVMALYFLALCLVVFLFMRHRFGDAAAGAAVLLLTGSFGSVYLARSLYGEVPALFYAVTALLLWERALSRPRISFAGVLAGAVFALALLSKLFFAIAVAPFLAILLYDRFQVRLVSWRHVAVPLMSFLVVWGAWMTVESVHGAPEGSGPAESAAMHAHYLLFGFDSLPATAAWLLEQPVTVLVSALGVIYVLSWSLRRPVEHPSACLFLLAPFFVFWWLFFTTGRHPRYMFYACAIAGSATGPLLVSAARYARDRARHAMLPRFLVTIALVAGSSPALVRTWEQIRMVSMSTEARNDIAAARYIETLPGDARIATTYWPLSRTLDFLTDRPVEMLRELPQDMSRFDLVLIDQHTQQDLLEGQAWERSLGRYAVLSVRGQ